MMRGSGSRAHSVPGCADTTRSFRPRHGWEAGAPVTPSETGGCGPERGLTMVGRPGGLRLVTAATLSNVSEEGAALEDLTLAPR